ncbi:MAG: hydantoinase B/oxoprolinase family protein [Kofleriaceae bacterium]|nr:hydantoinase B/oxoprolinase family protein [Kofleriaceae bacterium]
MATSWQFWIDRGGTFTDCIGVSPGGTLTTAKVLSSATAPLDGIRELLGLAAGARIPRCELRMGTTIATNALLERQGTPTALVISAGFRDLLAIGTQARSDLFALDIVKPEMLYSEVLEVDARLDQKGEIIARPNQTVLRAELRALLGQGIESLAVVVLHSYKNPALENEIRDIALDVGFLDVSTSSEVSGEIGFLARGDTTVVDAYLTPLIRNYLESLKRELPGSRILLMQSSGGLCGVSEFRGKNAVLSGPAGGVIAYSKLAAQAGFDKAIGFDMGGTSTDVSAFDGEVERSYESEVAGVRLRAPMMKIHTVAAGGGSICRDNGFRFTVGPESTGASPGPICYDKGNVDMLSITDCNLALGRIVEDHFPFPLRLQPVLACLENISLSLEKRGIRQSPLDIAAGFVRIANANMAAAIGEVTTAQGRDLREFSMVVLGGAGGQHACAVARQLGVRTLLIDRLSGVLSAYGMGLAELSWHGQADATGFVLSEVEQLEERFRTLESRGKATLRLEGATEIHAIRRVDLRYAGTDSAISVAVGESLAADFRAEHLRRYGYSKPAGKVEVVAVRVELRDLKANHTLRKKGTLTSEGSAHQAIRTHTQWSNGQGLEVPVFERSAIPIGGSVIGPAILLDSTGTICLDLGWEAELVSEDSLVLTDLAPTISSTDVGDTSSDPVRLEIFSNLFMSIAVQMGNALRATAVSANIRERLDFSCAVFDASGSLIANAPHIPVHLGAMGESIKGILKLHPNPAPGSVYASNDPSLGGSHLPDITVVTPVHDTAGTLIFFTASRGHHADIGGIAPGSMPPFSRTLEEEGIVLRAVAIVEEGVFLQEKVERILSAGPMPARSVPDNVADLQAQIAANQRGVQLLSQLLEERGAALVRAYMGHVQDNAAAQVAASIEALPDGEYQYSDAMDEGSIIAVALRVQGSTMRVDFSGSSEQVEGNLNAPRAVSVAAVMYVLRTMVQQSIPLNAGCLRNIEIHVPKGTILNPDEGRAVAAGNVETSQRVVDVLLGALGLSAASQGTMNNLSFGNDNFGYYETIAGGAGASARADGASGVHTHMTNTRITDPEVLESRFPVRLHEFSLRPNSGGAGEHRGGDGLIREMEALEPLTLSIISERRSRQPFGLAGGSPGQSGRNLHEGKELPGKVTIQWKTGERIRIETPGGGGYGPEAN